MSKSSTLDENRIMDLVHKKRKCAVCGGRVIIVPDTTVKISGIVTRREYKCKSCGTVCYYTPGLMEGRRIRFVYGNKATKMIEQNKVPEWMEE